MKKKKGISLKLLKQALIGEAAWFQIFNDLKIEMNKVLQELKKRKK